MKKLLLNTLIAGIFALSPTIYATHNGAHGFPMQNTCPGKMCPMGCPQDGYDKYDHFHNMLATLDLSAEQQKQFTDIKQKYTAQMQSLCKKMHDCFTSLKNFTGNNYNSDKVKQMANGLGSVISQKIQLKMQMFNELYHQLTPAQQEQIQQRLNQKHNN